MNCNRPRLLLILWLLPCSLFGRTIDLQGQSVSGVQSADWSYQGERGPDNWSRLSPDYLHCQTGSFQSPIDLRPTATGRLSPLRFHYRTSPLRIRNDGLSIRLDYEGRSYLRVGDAAYQLKELVFRIPGEHRLEGQATDLEIQMLHRNGSGDFLMLAIPVVAGDRRNAMLERIWEHLPAKSGSGSYYRQVGVNPVFLIPSDHRYYRYRGSLTEPPCTEPVTWFVMRKPMEISRYLIDRLRRSMDENSRPIQAVNGRAVMSSR